MSAAEMKKKIQEKVEQINDEKTLEQLLELLSVDKPIDATRFKEKLFSENDGLLKRLA